EGPRDERANAYNLWGICLSDRGDYLEAVNKLKLAIVLDPNYSNAYMNFADNELLAGNKNEALKMYEKALAVKPDNWLVYDGWSNILYKKKELVECAEKCR